MYTDRTANVYQRKTHCDDKYHKTGEESLSLRFKDDSTLYMHHEVRHGSGFLPRTERWAEVSLFTYSREHHNVFVQVMMGWMPLVIFADWLEERCGDWGKRESHPGDLEYLLGVLRKW